MTCKKCNGHLVRSHDETMCLTHGLVDSPARAWDFGGDLLAIDYELLDLPTRGHGKRQHFADAKPAFAFDDRGCHAHPACLTCPFETCLQDTGSYADFRDRVAARRGNVRALNRIGLSIQEIARRLGIGPRTVSSDLAVAS